MQAHGDEKGHGMVGKGNDFGVTDIVHDWGGDLDIICIWIKRGVGALNRESQWGF